MDIISVSANAARNLMKTGLLRDYKKALFPMGGCNPTQILGTI
jgi:hypothetical protein